MKKIELFLYDRANSRVIPTIVECKKEKEINRKDVLRTQFSYYNHFSNKTSIGEMDSLIWNSVQ